MDFTEIESFFFLLVDFRRNEGKGRWSNTWNAQLTFTGQIQIPHCIISPGAISVPLSPSQNERGKKSKREQLPLFFPDHLVEASNGNRVTRCRGVSATAFPNFRNNGPCVRVRARVVVRIPTPSRSQRINANAQREREREARGERRRGCRIVRASRTKRKRKSETRIGLIKASKQCRGCRRWLNNVWLAKSPYGT